MPPIILILTTKKIKKWFISTSQSNPNPIKLFQYMSIWFKLLNLLSSENSLSGDSSCEATATAWETLQLKVDFYIQILLSRRIHTHTHRERRKRKKTSTEALNSATTGDIKAPETSVVMSVFPPPKWNNTCEIERARQWCHQDNTQHVLIWTFTERNSRASEVTSKSIGRCVLWLLDTKVSYRYLYSVLTHTAE